MTVRMPYRSSVYVVEPAIYVSDAQNRIGRELTGSVLGATVDEDIDRIGGKGECQITVDDGDLLRAWQWIAFYLKVTPEVGPAVMAQLGLFRLDQPQRENVGDGQRVATATGEDMVSVMERQVLTAPLTLPPLLNVMRAVRMVTEMCGRPPQAANLVLNPTFADGFAKWVPNMTAGMSGSWTTNTGRTYAPEGAAKFVTSGGGVSLLNAYAGVYQATPDLPRLVPGAQTIRQTFWAYMENTNLRPVGRLEFYDASDTLLSFVQPNSSTTEAKANEWVPVTVTAPVPAGAVKVRAQARIIALVASGIPDGTQTWVSDFWVGEERAGGLKRHAYPDYPAQTQSWQTWGAGTRLTEVTNDLLASIGHFSANATRDGQPTSAPMRDVANDTPVRVWSIGRDSELTGALRVERSTGNVYNVVVVSQEDYENKTADSAVARNDEAAHPWSTVNIGEIAHEPIIVTSDTSKAAMQALADLTLARTSELESLSLAVLPDPTLSTYDVIEVRGADGPEDGKWGIERVAWNLDPEEPLVQVAARRTKTVGMPSPH